MKNAPFLLSSSLGLLAVILSFWSFGASQTNNSLQSELLKKQTEFQSLNNTVTLQNQEYQRQAEIINSGNNLGEKVMAPILGRMGYVAAKNNNQKFRDMLNKLNFGDVIPTAEKLKEIDAEIKKNEALQKGAGAGSAAPAPGTPKTPAPAATVPPP